MTGFRKALGVKALGVLAVSAGLALGVCGPAGATVVLDQVSLETPGFNGFISDGAGFGRAQTFTVGIAGLLDSVEVTMLPVFVAGPGDNPTTLRILATSGGVPVGGSGGSTVLATSSSVIGSGGAFTFDLSAAALAVDVGDVLAIEILGGGWSWAEGANSYAGGGDYFFNGSSTPDWTANDGIDNAFRTFVENGLVTAVPEPASLALFGAGLAGLAGLAGVGPLRRRQPRR
jgi:hypothetical protein